MLKSVMYWILLLTTAARFIDLIYVLAKDSTNLPVAVLVVTTAMVIYGIVLAVKKFVNVVRIKQLMMFYMVQSAMIVFNLVYMAFNNTLQIGFAEMVVVGSFLDLLINCAIIYACTRHFRNGQVIYVQSGTLNEG